MTEVSHIRCPACGTLNRAPTRWPSIPKCGRCSSPLVRLGGSSTSSDASFFDEGNGADTNKKYRLDLRISASKKSIWSVTVLCCLVISVWGYYFLITKNPADSHGQLARAAPTALPEPLLRPWTGMIFDRSGEQLLAPLKIITEAGADYVLKFSRVGKADSDIWIYIRGGEEFEMRAPLGVFELRYATGENWSGYDRLFGSNTAYQMADRSFEFSRSTQGYAGHTIRLIKRVDGNMRTRSIRPSDF